MTLKNRKFESLIEESRACGVCKVSGKEEYEGLFQTSYAMPCKQCGGLGYVDILTGEEFGPDDIYRAWMLVRDHFYNKVVNLSKANRSLKESLYKHTGPREVTKSDVYPPKDDLARLRG